ncbi:MAG: hypothetical protein L3J50_04155, partial [Emcibacter sp.]|nr:hypothetical protein [Emcibacter sp.]
SIKLKNAHKTDPENRIRDDSAALCKEENLICQFDIPNAASALYVEASLSNRTITCSMELLAPSDKKTTKARMNWLVKQFSKLSKKEIDQIRIGAKWPGGAQITWAGITELRDDPICIQTSNKKLVPHRFIVQTVLDMAGKFSGQRTFIEGLEKTVTQFYYTVGENLSTWVPPAPKFEDNPENESLE